MTRRQRGRPSWVLAAVGAAACGGGDGGAGEPPDAGGGGGGVTALFSPPVPGAGADWGAIPYPSDLFLDADGQLALGRLPVGPSPSEVLDHHPFYFEGIDAPVATDPFAD